MLSCTRWLKIGYFLALTTALVLLLSKPAPIQAQRSIAYVFLPGAGTTAAAMGQVLASGGTPMHAYTNAMTQLQQAAIPAGLSATGGIGMSGGALGVGGGVGGIGGGGGMGGMGGGMMGMGGGMMGMGGNMGGGMRGGFGGGMGGMGGFAGKGMGGFNGKKPL